MTHDGDAQPGYVTELCFREVDGCDNPRCACCCHDEIEGSFVNIDESSVNEAVSRALAR